MLGVSDIRDCVSAVAPLYDVERVYLFGSRARGDAREGSDVDLCLETGPSFSLLSAGGLSHEIEQALGVPVDVVTARSLYPFVRKGFERDKVVVYERV